MQVLLRYSKLPPTVLQGSLEGSDPPRRTAVLGQVKLQSLGEFWQSMGGKPKVALNYSITLAVPVDGGSQTLPLVMNSLVSEGNDG
jgi:hypothetical protein